MSVSVPVVFLLFELGHQAEFPAAAAFGKIQRHILWWKERKVRIRPQVSRARVSPLLGEVAGGLGLNMLCSRFTCVFPQFSVSYLCLMPLTTGFAVIGVCLHVVSIP